MPSPTEESEGLDRPNAPGLAGLERTVHSSAIFHECSYEFVEAIMLQIRKILLHPGSGEGRRCGATLHVLRALWNP